MHERDRIYLDVPYAEKDQAKALRAITVAEVDRYREHKRREARFR